MSTTLHLDEFVTALGLPPSCRVGQRVPKKLLLEHGAPTAADKRLIADGVAEIHWVAALKPNTIGVPAYVDGTREYLEVAVLTTALRETPKRARLAELIHRAIPYPVLLIASAESGLSITMAHKRWSQGEHGATVLDGEMTAGDIDVSAPPDAMGSFRMALDLGKHPRSNLFVLYQSWMDALLALAAARLTGTFTLAETPEHAVARREALREYARLGAEITRLRAAAVKERQIARQAAINFELKRVEQQRLAAHAQL